MTKIIRAMTGVIAAAGIMLGAAASAEAKECVRKGAVGEAGSEKDAKFQVDEALLQAVDWGAWAAWMSNGTTPLASPSGESPASALSSCAWTTVN